MNNINKNIQLVIETKIKILINNKLFNKNVINESTYNKINENLLKELKKEKHYDI